ncbi:Homeodomain-like protein [Phycomyces nitens]|nr:Homeodomain-like protein [Phycomyces nitens]
MNLLNFEHGFSMFKQQGKKSFYSRWTDEENEILARAVSEHGLHQWNLVAKHFSRRTPSQCSSRWFGALNPEVVKGKWTDEEDNALRTAVEQYSLASKTPSWSRVAKHIPRRTGIQCQARWTEALDPMVRKGRWLPSEDGQLVDAVHTHGCCWVRVANDIVGRTQRQCRTRWSQLNKPNKSKPSNNTSNQDRFQEQAYSAQYQPFNLPDHLQDPNLHPVPDVLGDVKMNQAEWPSALSIYSTLDDIANLTLPLAYSFSIQEPF